MRQLRFHVEGEWCDSWVDEPRCDVCERRFNITEARIMNDCVVWADLVVGEPGWGLEFYLTGPADCLSWYWEDLNNIYAFD